MALKRSVILRGTPEINEEGTASAEVRPGYLVTGVTSISHYAVAGGNTPRALALERSELGAGIDNTYQGSGTPSAFYASGEVVKVATFAPGQEATVFVASGYGVAVNGQLQSHGDGTFRPLEGSNTPLAISTEAVTGSGSVAAIRVRFF
jgi:hypothetical protein